MNILHIEDSEFDCDLVGRTLSREGLKCQIKRVETREEVIDSLQYSEYDIVLADYKLPRFSGKEALELVLTLKPEIPFIFVSGTMGEEVATEMLKIGATDYVLKDRLYRLVFAIQRALREVEERRMVQRLKQAVADSRRMEVIGTVSKGVARHFDGILATILGQVSLIRQFSTNPQQVLNFAGFIDEAAHRGAEIIRELEACCCQFDGHFQPLNLNEHIKKCLDKNWQKLPAGIELRLQLTEPLPQINADPSYLYRILNHLIANSVDAIIGEGEIVLETFLVKADRVRELEGVFHPSDQYICVSIRDNGIGMDAPTYQKALDPFFTTKPLNHRLGLGLPSVYGLMKSHRGAVDIQSEKGGGTTVYLFFPVDIPKQALKE